MEDSHSSPQTVQGGPPGRREFIGRVGSLGILSASGALLVTDATSGRLSAAPRPDSAPDDPVTTTCSCDCYCYCECDCGCACSCVCSCVNTCESSCNAACNADDAKLRDAIRSAMNINLDTNSLNTNHNGSHDVKIALTKKNDFAASIKSTLSSSHTGFRKSAVTRLRMVLPQPPKEKEN